MCEMAPSSGQDHAASASTNTYHPGPIDPDEPLESGSEHRPQSHPPNAEKVEVMDSRGTRRGQRPTEIHIPTSHHHSHSSPTHPCRCTVIGTTDG